MTYLPYLAHPGAGVKWGYQCSQCSQVPSALLGPGGGGGEMNTWMRVNKNVRFQVTLRCQV